MERTLAVMRELAEDAVDTKTGGSIPAKEINEFCKEMAVAREHCIHSMLRYYTAFHKAALSLRAFANSDSKGETVELFEYFQLTRQNQNMRVQLTAREIEVDKSKRRLFQMVQIITNLKEKRFNIAVIKSF